ncbi:MAG TPA: arginine deiminase family protein [Vicinamibacterales bacterium]|jgi:N-dimethylarginine dimethylaminohydrolase|nr:arginine deiminase family protein [Vicinamibacterales bacterium]
MEVTLNEFDHLTHVAVKHARDAFVSAGVLARQWASHGFTAAPDFDAACREHDAFLEILADHGAELTFLPADTGTTIDSIYARDASLVAPRGVVLCAMGKPARHGEPGAQRRAFAAAARPGTAIAGSIEPPGRIEGGDVVWFDDRTVAVGRGYRTNAEGLRQFAALLGPQVEVIEVPLPHWKGPGDVMHLMSLLSPVDRDLAVVYSRLLPVPFHEQLVARGITLLDTPDEEFESMGTNVLALAPRLCVMLAGNPRTRAALERAGAAVVEYQGNEISLKGGGGPTCLTRPLVRAR